MPPCHPVSRTSANITYTLARVAPRSSKWTVQSTAGRRRHLMGHAHRCGEGSRPLSANQAMSLPSERRLCVFPIIRPIRPNRPIFFRPKPHHPRPHHSQRQHRRYLSSSPKRGFFKGEGVNAIVVIMQNQVVVNARRCPQRRLRGTILEFRRCSDLGLPVRIVMS